MEQYRLRHSSVLIISGFDKLNISRFRVKLKLHAAEIRPIESRKICESLHCFTWNIRGASLYRDDCAVFHLFIPVFDALRKDFALPVFYYLKEVSALLFTI